MVVWVKQFVIDGFKIIYFALPPKYKTVNYVKN